APRLLRGSAIDDAVAVDLGVIADPLEQPVDDPRGAPAATSDEPRGVGLDPDTEDPRRAVDDRGQVGVVVEVEPVRGAEAVAQRRADSAGARRGSGDR